MADRRWGIRVADVRLPRTWPLAVVISVLLAHMTERRQLRELRRIGAEFGEYVGTRDQEAAEREARLLALTRTLTRLTWVLLAVTVAALAVAAVTLARS